MRLFESVEVDGHDVLAPYDGIKAANFKASRDYCAHYQGQRDSFAENNLVPRRARDDLYEQALPDLESCRGGMLMLAHSLACISAEESRMLAGMNTKECICWVMVSLPSDDELLTVAVKPTMVVV